MYIAIQQFDKRFRDIVRLLDKKKSSEHRHWHNQKLDFNFLWIEIARMCSFAIY